MAKSPRTAAPCSACSTVIINDGATPSPIHHRPLMSLSAIINALSGVDGAIAGLCELLGAAGDTRVYAARIEALIAPVHRQLSQACDDLNDLPLLELGEGMRPMVPGDVLLKAPKKLTYEFFTTCGACALEIRGEGFKQTFRRFHVPMGREHARYWTPGHWTSDETRTDHLGRNWHGAMRTYITDDFGQLVALKGGAA